MEIELKNEFEIETEGTKYALPCYEVGKDGLELVGSKVIVHFVRGSKVAEEKVTPHVGTLHEHLLSMMIHDLRYKNELVPSREGALALTKLQEAYMWMVQRQIDRKSRGVQGTYKR